MERQVWTLLVLVVSISCCKRKSRDMEGRYTTKMNEYKQPLFGLPEMQIYDSTQITKNGMNARTHSSLSPYHVYSPAQHSIKAVL